MANAAIGAFRNVVDMTDRLESSDREAVHQLWDREGCIQSCLLEDSNFHKKMLLTGLTFVSKWYLFPKFVQISIKKDACLRLTRFSILTLFLHWTLFLAVFEPNWTTGANQTHYSRVSQTVVHGHPGGPRVGFRGSQSGPWKNPI